MHSILVIDDEKLILNMLKLALTQSGYEVELAINGKEGVKKFDNGCYDLVITDMRMPELDGSGVVKHIRNSQKRFTPVIGISGTPWLFKNCDFDTVIPKPFPIKTLESSIHNLVGTSTTL